MESWRIETTIHNADISTGDALEGYCGPIARAIKLTFGGEYVVVKDDDGHPRHAAVLINGVMYDGTGATTKENIGSLFEGPFDSAPLNTQPDEHPNLELTATLASFIEDSEYTHSLIDRLQPKE